jgi:hypothetical protein
MHALSALLNHVTWQHYPSQHNPSHTTRVKIPLRVTRWRNGVGNLLSHGRLPFLVHHCLVGNVGRGRLSESTLSESRPSKSRLSESHYPSQQQSTELTRKVVGHLLATMTIGRVVPHQQLDHHSTPTRNCRSSPSAWKEHSRSLDGAIPVTLLPESSMNGGGLERVIDGAIPNHHASPSVDSSP